MPTNSDSSKTPILTQNSSRQKAPKQILATSDRAKPTIFAFSPNRDTLGGTAYLVCEEVNILVDCPAWDEATQAFLQSQGGVQWLVITHRGAIGKARNIQQALGCAIAIQEQEAYLLPKLSPTSFQHTLALTDASRLLWTPGHSPGSACLHYAGFGGVLFSGRHLLPTAQGHLSPIKTTTTFHWGRQQQSIQTLRETFASDTLHYICPGANIGFLRGKSFFEQGYDHLAKISGDE
jgi:glyoxylase-like metal-dependent hydrolase (beta-lactamase superfamily II)